MNRPPILTVSVDIRRPPQVVRDWWLNFPDTYVATDPKEQPHRIEVLSREEDVTELLTYWRGPFGRELRLPETLTEHDALHWSFDVDLPFGLGQRDDFTLTPTPEGTRVDIVIRLWARLSHGHLFRSAYIRYAQKTYPRTWAYAAKACERDTPPEQDS